MKHNGVMLQALAICTLILAAAAEWESTPNGDDWQLPSLNHNSKSWTKASTTKASTTKAPTTKASITVGNMYAAAAAAHEKKVDAKADSQTCACVHRNGKKTCKCYQDAVINSAPGPAPTKSSNDKFSVEKFLNSKAASATTTIHQATTTTTTRKATAASTQKATTTTTTTSPKKVTTTTKNAVPTTTHKQISTTTHNKATATTTTTLKKATTATMTTTTGSQHKAPATTTRTLIPIHNMKDMPQLMSAADQLQARALACEDSLQNAQKVVYTCDEEVQKAVKTRADADAKSLQTVQQELAEMTRKVDVLRKDNLDLMQRLADKEKLLAAAARSGDAKPGSILKENKELLKEKESLQADKEGLMKTIQNLLKTNQSEAQAEKQTTTIVTEMKEKQKQMEHDYRQKQLKMDHDYRQRVQALEKQVQELKQKSEDVKDVAQTLQSQNSGLYEDSDKLRSDLQKCQGNVKDLGDDKKQLVASLQDVLRQNIKYQEELSEKALHGPKPSKAEKAFVDSKLSMSAAYVSPKDDDIVATMGETNKMDHYIATSLPGSNVSPPVVEDTQPMTAQRPAGALRATKAPKAAKPKSKLSKYLADAPTESPANATANVDELDDTVAGNVRGLLGQAEQAVYEANSPGDSTSTEDNDDK